MAFHGSIVFLLLASLWAASQVSAANGDTSDCCLKVSKHKVPQRIVSDYKTLEPNSSCVRALVLITVKGKYLCVPHNADWAKKIVKHIDNSKRKKRHVSCQSEERFNQEGN